ncbi:uncharacterized protein N7473_000478 [Penicillium subrubescens]|uniref:uncharacterized protein n=1 Tax=Penicillium subrubescens TaxID=1316194 RepID=UPI002544DD75|nr:uncharacterized protein N7473_000478 [Penicillium subrubescens]KAJ5911175.1 hypothetical protein N7473_000478 [Penicillium subrubescens]
MLGKLCALPTWAIENKKTAPQLKTSLTVEDRAKGLVEALFSIFFIASIASIAQRSPVSVSSFDRYLDPWASQHGARWLS